MHPHATTSRRLKHIPRTPNLTIPRLGQGRQATTNGTAAQQDAQAFPVQVSLELLGLKISLQMHISITNLAANNSNGPRLWYVRRSLAVLFNTIANALFPDAERTASTEI